MGMMIELSPSIDEELLDDGVVDREDTHVRLFFDDTKTVAAKANISRHLHRRWIV